MLKHLALNNIGPAPTMNIDFSPRLNILTGDNGLGKSFILDIAWWALTRKWPSEVNSKLTASLPARPTNPGAATISFKLDTQNGTEVDYTSEFKPREGGWVGRQGRPHNPGLVLYAMSDGSFAVWDPARNYWRTRNGQDFQDRPSAYVFTAAEAWNGLTDAEGRVLCKGLLADWAQWYTAQDTPYRNLMSVLEALSTPDEPIEPRNLVRISLDDVRDIPTIRMPYGTIPVVHASSGIRRILTLAYLLLWAWTEHERAAREILNETPASQIILLIDEVESHLHPKWQRTIVPSLLGVVQSLSQGARTQIITATHSPLVLASIESRFNSDTDAWFDLDVQRPREGERASVALRKMDFHPLGDASSWLTSEAFDLKRAGSVDSEIAFQKLQEFMRDGNKTIDDANRLEQEIAGAFSDIDPIWVRWRAFGRRQGWWE